MKNLVVNLHLLEQCNYHCGHCFSHFGLSEPLHLSKWKKIADNILGYPFVSRINLAGGEPLLLPWIQDFAEYIREKGIEVSIITNGSLLKEKFLKHCKISMVGISIDSFNEETLIKMGRYTLNSKPLPEEQVYRLCSLVKDNCIDLKINTVVTKLNLTDDFSPLINIAPKRWKILRMQPFEAGNFSNFHLGVTDEEYNSFCRKQEALGIPFVAENIMVNSYIFIDPAGCLIDNTGGIYTSAGNLLNEDFYECFKRLPLNTELYDFRYKESSFAKNQNIQEKKDEDNVY